jgi:hypothetical protein
VRWSSVPVVNSGTPPGRFDAILKPSRFDAFWLPRIGEKATGILRLSNRLQPLIVWSFIGSAAAFLVLVVGHTTLDWLLSAGALLWCAATVALLVRRVRLLAAAVSEWFGVRIRPRDLRTLATSFDAWVKELHLEVPDCSRINAEGAHLGSSVQRNTGGALLPITRADVPPILGGAAVGVLMWTATNRWPLGVAFGIAGVITFTLRRRRIRASRNA